MNKTRTVVELEELRSRLREAEETLAAIRTGEVDSLVVNGENGLQVFSLRGAEQPYRVFVEQMQQGAVTLDTDGTILYANRSFAGLVGAPLEQVIGQRMQRFLSASDGAAFDRLLEKREENRGQFTLQGGSGTGIAVSLSLSTLPLDGAEATCVVVTDLTELAQKRELVQALQRLTVVQEELKTRNADLERMNQSAAAASEAKDRFLASLSHELRTPLTPVLITVHSLQEDEGFPAHYRPDLALIRRNIELEAHLIDDLLDLTRIVRGKVELKTGDVDVAALVQGTLEICRSEIAAKRMRLTVEPPPAGTIIQGDSVRLQQVLWNLLRNAVKFTPAGGEITLRGSVVEGGLKVEVIDTGIGIDAEAMPRLFTPFQQAGPSITQQFGGLGLGLAISKRLAEMHGGDITVSSAGAGQGSTFCLTLPARLPASPAPEVPALEAGGAQRQAEEKRLRILLVEDHEDTRRSMTRLLRRHHEIEAVGTVSAALETAHARAFDLVISDVGLPDGSGLELMMQLRERHDLRGICLSGYGTDEDQVRSQAAGFVHHLTKPVNLAQLEGAIRSVAGRGGAAVG